MYGPSYQQAYMLAQYRKYELSGGDVYKTTTLGAYVDAIQSHSDNIFQAIAAQDVSINWRHTGDLSYKICGMDELALLKSMIKSSPEQKTFNFIDVGAGDCRLFRNLRNHINHDSDIPKDVVINLISFTGEKYPLKQSGQEGHCHLFEWDQFNVENFEENFKKKAKEKDLDPAMPFDAIFSRLCFIHLVNPVCVFTTLYNRLRAGTGILLSDGFRYLINDEIPLCAHFNYNLFALLLETKSQFLVDSNVSLPFDPSDPFSTDEPATAVNHFILRKTDDKRFETPLKYKCFFQTLTDRTDTPIIIGFDAPEHMKLTTNINWTSSSNGRHSLSGSETLHEYLSKQEKIYTPWHSYQGPLLKNSADYERWAERKEAEKAASARLALTTAPRVGDARTDWSHTLETKQRSCTII